MTDTDELVLYYAPRTRSFTGLWLVEETGQPYRLESFDISTGRHRKPDYMAFNPMGKVPLVVDHGTPVAELGAMAIYLADRFPESKMGPGIGDPHRADFLRWTFFASAIMEPCLGEKFFKWEVPSTSVAWGSFERMMTALVAALEKGPYLLGETFCAADVLVSSTLRFGHMFGAIEKEGVTVDYVERLAQREACLRAAEIERREGARFPPRQS